MISKAQYKKLKQIDKHNGTTGKDYGSQREMYDYLLSEKLIYKADVRNYRGYRVSQKGYSEIYSYKIENFRFWVPTTISILALIFSCLSITIRISF